MSEGHFHRSFRAAVGETPRAYTQRLRLERAALRLLLHDERVLDVALDCGFHNHETFTRAFRRHFGLSPREYRRRPEQVLGPSSLRRPDPPGEVAATTYELSATRVHAVERIHLACLRHVGPYEQVPDSLFRRLGDWARRRCLPGARRYLGIGHDAPGITAADRLRFDAGLRVPGRFSARGEVVHQTLEPGLFAVTTHVGAYATLAAAYPRIFERAATLRGYRLIALPAVELYQTTHMDAERAVNHTDIYLPVERS